MNIPWTARIATGLVVLFAADWFSCRALLHRMQGEYAQWRQAMESQGWQVRNGTVSGTYFPLGATLQIPDLELSGGQALVPGGLDWHAERASLSLSVFHPLRLDIAPQGQQTLRAAAGQALLLNADHLIAEVPLGGGKPDHIRIMSESLTAGLRGSDHPQDVRIDGLNVEFTATRGDSGRTGMGFDMQAHGVGLPDLGRWPLGATINKLTLQFSLASPALSGRAPAEQARAWRDWGGTMNISTLAVKWGPLDMKANFVLGLDQQLQPTGRGHTDISGWSPALDAMASGGAIPDGMAQTAKAVLSLMAPQADGASGPDAPISLPIKLKDSTLSLGPIPLLHLRHVAWGGV